MARSDTTKQLQPRVEGSLQPHHEDLLETAVIDDSGGDPAQANGTAESTLPEPGSFVGKYEIIRQIGQGGMSTVFLARDPRLGRRVALKFLQDCRPQLTSRFLDEARATARCSHENIVVIHDVGEYRGRPFMALEYVTGDSLRVFLRDHIGPSSNRGIRTGSALSSARAIEIMIPVLRALVRAHAMGIIHRDLKPDNIMLTEAGTIKVLDFGIAKFLARPEDAIAGDADWDGEMSMSRTGPDLRIGTLPYMSPEQINGDVVDHRSDIWACGIMLYEMVTARHPLAPISGRRIVEAAAQLDEPMPGVEELAPEVGQLAAIVDRCLLKQADDRTATASELLAELEALRPDHRQAVLGQDTSPFAGLAAFQEADADRFFGRQQEIANAVARLRSQPLLAIVGPSGAGKSSLVRAGIIPALKRSGEGWDAHIIRPGRHPVVALARVLQQTSAGTTQLSIRADSQSSLDELASLADEMTIGQQLYKEPGYLGAVLRTRASKKLRRAVIFVDQFEELYTLGAGAKERSAFVSCLEAIADDASSPLRVIISMRSDFLDHMAGDRALSQSVMSGLLFLPPIGRDGLRQALLRPVEAVGYRFERREMVESMLDELEQTQGALPLLQFTAAKLWDVRDGKHRVLEQSSYEELGGVAGALASHADAVLAGMSSSDQHLARTVLERLVTPERTRAIVSMSELRAASTEPDDIDHAVDHLARARLVLVETLDDDDGAMIELIHESLIDGWPKLSLWLDEHREDAAFLARLRTAAKQWESIGRAEGILWRDESAGEALRWHARYRGELSPLEREYLDATFALANRSARIKRVIFAGSIAFLSLLVFAAAVALVWIRQAEREATQQAAIVQAQLSELQQKESELRSKEAESRAAAEVAQAATREAEMTKEQLREVLRTERMAKEQAERAAVEAREALERERETKKRLRTYVRLGPQKTKKGIRFNYRPRGRPKTVYLAGTFNNWNPSTDHRMRDVDGDGIFSVTISLKKGSHQYKFVVDGTWVRDPNAPMSHPDGYGGLNGKVEVD